MSPRNHIEDARDLVTEGQPEETITYQLTLPAGMAVEIAEATPPGTSLQHATRMLLFLALVEAAG